MLASVLTLTLATATACPQGPADGLLEAIARLAVPATRDDAAEEILAGEPEVAVPALVACIIERPDAHAWQALRVLRRSAGACGARQERVLADAATALVGAAMDTESTSLARQIRLLAIGAVGRADADTARSLIATMSSSQPVELVLAATIASAQLGRPGVAPLQKEINDKAGLLPAALTMAALGAMGEQGKGALPKLKATVTDHRSTRAWLLAYSARAAMRRIAGAKSTDALWHKRRKKVGNKAPNFPIRTVNLNARAMAPDLLVFQLAELTNIDDVRKFALPASFEGNPVTAGDGCRQIMAHAGDDLADICAALVADRLTTEQDWSGRLRGPTLSWELLRKVFDRAPTRTSPTTAPPAIAPAAARLPAARSPRARPSAPRP
ncbi:MAG: hypothetical protein KDC98_13090 [Planctomycetes bacterium]|nr:hypothetical protein [Planctomycetota bacterium]